MRERETEREREGELKQKVGTGERGKRVSGGKKKSKAQGINQSTETVDTTHLKTHTKRSMNK